MMPKIVKRKGPPPPAGGSKQDTLPGSNKTFSVSQWDDTGGEKVIVYGRSGMGKTTLCSTAPKPVFIPIDDGSRRIKNPVTGERLHKIDGIETYDDVRAVLNDISLFDNYETVVLDTFTKLQDWAEPVIYRTYKKKDSKPFTSLKEYGYGDGFGYLVDTMKFILQDCDKLVRAGKNVILICQADDVKVSNAGGDDYLCSGPNLFHRSDHSVLCPTIEWADHIFRIDYKAMHVESEKAFGGKKAGKITGDTTRMIITKEQPHFVAKSRTLDDDCEFISFDSASDTSIWDFVFPNEDEGE
jgi:hypothetical protein